MALTTKERNISHIDVFYFESPDPKRSHYLSFHDTKTLQRIDPAMLPKVFDEYQRACAFSTLNDFQDDVTTFMHKKIHPKTDADINESVYEFLNIAEQRSKFPNCRKYHSEKRGIMGIRSMSVGDVICYDIEQKTKCYEVANTGFDAIDPTAFKHQFNPDLPYNKIKNVEKI